MKIFKTVPFLFRRKRFPEFFIEQFQFTVGHSRSVIFNGQQQCFFSGRTTPEKNIIIRPRCIKTMNKIIFDKRLEYVSDNSVLKHIRIDMVSDAYRIPIPRAEQ